jgi:hypothetical protein
MMKRNGAASMRKDEKAAALEAVCARRGLRVPQNDADSIAWKALAMSELAEHEPEFQERGKPGRPRKLYLAFPTIEFPTIEDVMLLLFSIEATRDPRKSRRQAYKLIGEHIKRSPDTIKDNLRKLEKKIIERDPKFLARLRKERGEINKIMRTHIATLKPEDKAEVEYMMQWFNGRVDILLGEN